MGDQYYVRAGSQQWEYYRSVYLARICVLGAASVGALTYSYLLYVEIRTRGGSVRRCCPWRQCSTLCSVAGALFCCGFAFHDAIEISFHTQQPKFNHSQETPFTSIRIKIATTLQMILMGNAITLDSRTVELEGGSPSDGFEQRNAPSPGLSLQWRALRSLFPGVLRGGEMRRPS